MRSWLRAVTGWPSKAAFLRRQRGTVSIGRHCEIPFRSLQANVRTLVIGHHVRIGERCCLSGESFTFGDYFYCGSDVVIAGGQADFEVGRFSSFGMRTMFILGRGSHRIQSLSSFPFGHVPPFETPDWTQGFDYDEEAKTFCRVGHDVWIGVGSVVLPNVTIGHGAVIAAGSVVKEDVAPYAVVGGNPAQVVSFRFKQTLITELLELAWWDWPSEKINQNKGLLTRNLMTRTSLAGLEVVA